MVSKNNDLTSQLAHILSTGLSRLSSDLTGALSMYKPDASEHPTPNDPATKVEANYRPQETDDSTKKGERDDYKRCGICEHFHVNRCYIVSGVIDAHYVCDYWTKRESDINREEKLPDQGAMSDN
jgi:hypothetical protein